jgi:hypothetical protein
MGRGIRRIRLLDLDDFSAARGDSGAISEKNDGRWPYHALFGKREPTSFASSSR